MEDTLEDGLILQPAAFPGPQSAQCSQVAFQLQDAEPDCLEISLALQIREPSTGTGLLLPPHSAETQICKRRIGEEASSLEIQVFGVKSTNHAQASMPRMGSAAEAPANGLPPAPPSE